MTNANFDFMRQMQQQKKAGPSKQTLNCKFCGVNSSKFVNNSESGDIICTNCGTIQNRIFVHQNERIKNGNILYARVMVEEDQKIKLLVNVFFNILFGDLKTENRAGDAIAKIYKDIKIFRANILKKNNIQSAFKGLHMPSIVCCILYCTLLEENRGMPLSLIVFNMNQALLKSRTPSTLTSFCWSVTL